MDSLWRGLKGAMVGMVIAAILVGECLALAALAGFLVGAAAQFVGHLPRKHLSVFKKAAIALGFATLASPLVVLGLRNWGIELPDLSRIYHFDEKRWSNLD